MSLLTIGTVAFDTIETPFGKAEKIIGGSASYISTSASYFVDYSNIVAVIGDDYPTEALAHLRDRNVDFQGLQIKEGEKSFFWAGKYHIDMNSRDTLDTQLNVLADFDPIIPDAYQDCEFLMLGNLSPDVQLKVTQRLNKRPKLVVLDTMNYWMDNHMNDLQVVLDKIDVLSINDEEARQLSGEFSLTKAARKILAMGPKYLIIKKGEHGALLFNNKEAFFAPALPLEDVFDPTGAGDTFAGGFIGYLAKTEDISFSNMKRAVIYGSAMASFCVEKFGLDRMWDMEKSEVNERVQDFIDLVQFEIKLD